MNSINRVRFQPALLLTAVLSGVVFTSCAMSPVPSASQSDRGAPASENYASSAPGQMAAPAAPVAQAQATANSVPSVTEVPRSQPQLAKTADMVLTVEAVDKSIDAIAAIARQQQGDILGLQDQTPINEYNRHTATLQLRVPQAKLDATLEALSALGTVQRQSLVAEDVSNQLVDFQARLRNLRKTEEMLLGIMERSGSVGDVLSVAQELSNVRNSIEQIDAQLKSLQNRVAYSTISLSLEEAMAANPPQRSVALQLEETWDGATHSLGKFTVDLLQLGIWLLVYSPYWLVFLGAPALGYWRLKKHQQRVRV